MKSVTDSLEEGKKVPNRGRQLQSLLLWVAVYVEPSCETGALLCRIFLFSQFETTAEVIKVTMTFFF